MNTVDDILAHYGVPGMKWGVRRVSKSKAKSSDAKEVERLLAQRKRQGIRSLTNDDLNTLNVRLQREQQLSRIAPQRGVAARGHHFVRNILAAGATLNGVMAFNNSPAGAHIRSMFNRPLVDWRNPL